MPAKQIKEVNIIESDAKEHPSKQKYIEALNRYFLRSIYEINYLGNLIGMRCKFPGPAVKGERFSLEIFCPTPKPILHLMWQRLNKNYSSAKDCDDEMEENQEVFLLAYRNLKPKKRLMTAFKIDQTYKILRIKIFGNPLVIGEAELNATMQHAKKYCVRYDLNEVRIFVICAKENIPNNQHIKINSLGNHEYVLSFNPKKLGDIPDSPIYFTQDNLDNEWVELQKTDAPSGAIIGFILRNENGTPRGYITINALAQVSNAAAIGNFSIDPDLQGNNLGRRLFEFAEATLRHLHLNSVYLDTMDYFVPKFYAAAGYKRMCSFDKAKSTEIFFHKQLPPINGHTLEEPKLRRPIKYPGSDYII